MLLQKFLQNAASHAGKTAVISAAGNRSYGELSVDIDRIASWLLPKIKTGDRIALLLDNSPDYISACYGVWAAGGVVVPLNTALKDQEVCRLIDHSGARLAVIQSKSDSLRQTLSNSGAATSPVDIQAVLLSGEQALAEYPGEFCLSSLPPAENTPQRSQVEEHSLAMIIYTSGTTGAPKGVMLSHDNLAQNAQAIINCLTICKDDTAMCVLPFYYSYGNSVLHTHLSEGATLVLENSLMYPLQVLKSMQHWKVSAFYGVPSTYHLLMARTGIEKIDLPQLRYCAQAGGPMSDVKIRQWRRLVNHASFIVMYGQTEATARLSCLPPTRLEDKAGSVGKAIPGVELSIQKKNGEILETGHQGEVCARGANTMLGYWRDAGATEEVLRQGWLRTGDLGYLDQDGYLFLVGRSRDMIKTGAHRVSPREIEESIAAIDGIDDVAVIGVEDDILGQVIKACIIVLPTAVDIRRRVLRHCRATLPAFKVPKEVAFYEDFPRTSSGKVKKHLLH